LSPPIHGPWPMLGLRLVLQALDQAHHHEQIPDAALDGVVQVGGEFLWGLEREPVPQLKRPADFADGQPVGAGGGQDCI
jgi:hypothetical protein